MTIDFRYVDFDERPVLVLMNQDGTALQTLGYACNLTANICYNEVSTIEFDIPKYANEEPVPHYDEVVGMRIVDMVGFGRFILVNPSTENDGVDEVKHVTGYSLEYELTFKKITLPESTYNLFDPLSRGESILDIIREYVPEWQVGTVSHDLTGRYRTFDVSNENIYNFMKDTLQESFGCVFDFDTYNRIIHVRSVNEITTAQPVFISLENLAEQIDIDEDTESIVTALDVNGADGVDIRQVDPMATNKIYNIDYFIQAGMVPVDIVDGWNDWKEAYESAQASFYLTSMQRTMLTAQMLVQANKIKEMTDNDLAKLYNSQAVKIEYLSGRSDSQEEAALRQINQQIEAKKAEIATENATLAGMEAQKEAYTQALIAISASVKFDAEEDGERKFFTDDQIRVLRRYFKEDSIEESSFVETDVMSYNGENKLSNGAMNNKVLWFETVETVAHEDIWPIQIEYWTSGSYSATTGDGGTITTVRGGRVKCADSLSGSTGIVLDAELISATIETEQDGKFVVAMNLKNGSYSAIQSTENPNGTFDSANMVVTGGYDSGGSTSIIAHESGASSLLEYLDGVLIEERTVIDSGYRLSVSTSIVYFTRDTTEMEKYSVAWDLYEYGMECLEKLAWPSYTFDVEAANFMALDDFTAFAHALKLGEKVYLDTDGFNGATAPLEPLVVGVEVDFEDPSSLKLQFSSTYNLSDSAFNLVDLLDESISMGKTVDTSRYTYNAFVNSGASTRVKEFMDGALDAAKNNILTGSEQAISWDSSGIHLRKDDGVGGYLPEQLAMINNTIAFTDDAWNTVKLAIGKIFSDSLTGYVFAVTKDESRVSGKTYYTSYNGNTGTVWDGVHPAWGEGILYEKIHGAYGIAAPYIVGEIIAGENLIITNSGATFTVDGSGATLLNSKFSLKTGNGLIEIDPTLGIAGGVDTSAKPMLDSSGRIIADAVTGSSTTAASKISQLSLSSWTPRAKFWLDMNGDVYVNGVLTAGSGSSIGGWTATNDAIYRGSSAWGAANSMYFGTDGISVGNLFSVTSGGALNAQSDSYIGDWWFRGGTLDGPEKYYNNRNYDEIVGYTTDYSRKIRISSTGGFYSHQYAAAGSGLPVNGYVNVGFARNSNITYDTFPAVESHNYPLALLSDDGVYIGPSDSLGAPPIIHKGWSLRPDIPSSEVVDSTPDLGASGFRWGVVYSKEINSYDLDTTSDRREKTNVSYDLSQYEGLFMALKPATFNYIEADVVDWRTRNGLIAQDVEQALYDNGLTYDDFKSLKMDPVYDEYDERGRPAEDATIVDYKYALDYTQFTGIIIHMLQKNIRKVEELEERIRQLEE